MNTRRSLRRPLPALLSSLALACMLPTAGCVSVICLGGCELTPTYDETRSTTVPQAEASPLRVKTRNGSITINKTSSGEVKVLTKIRASSPERLAAFVIDITKESDGTLDLHPTPPGNTWESNEGVSFEIDVPGTTRVEADTSNGAIRITNLAGQATLDTSNGSITITNHTGDVKALTSNGRIEATNLNGAIIADTSNGSIRVDLTDNVTGPVKLDTSNGAISLIAGPAFGGLVDIDTSNGSITIDAPSGATIKKNRSDATIQFPQSGGESILDTSNGSITFRIRAGGGGSSGSSSNSSSNTNEPVEKR